MVPMNQKVTIVKASGVDSWGEPIPETEATYACCFNEKSEVTEDQHGEVVHSKGYFLFKGFVNLDYNDKLKFVNELGETVEKDPVNIGYKRDLGAKVLFTKAVI